MSDNKIKVIEIVNRHCRYCDLASFKCVEDRDNQVEEILSLIKQERIRAATEAYTMFLKVLKDSKNKFPGKKEFEIVVDVRDVEKSLKELRQRNKGEM